MACLMGVFLMYELNGFGMVMRLGYYVKRMKYLRIEGAMKQYILPVRRYIIVVKLLDENSKKAQTFAEWT